MGFARWQIALVVAVTSVAAPLGIVVWLLFVPFHSQADIVAAVVVSGVWIVALVLANWWEFTSIHLRWVWVALFAACAAARLASWSVWPHWAGLTWQLGLSAAIAAVGVWLVVLASGGRRYFGTPLAAAFPLAEGRYLVTDGGDGKSAPLTNYHYGFRTHRRSGVNASMRFATDIVAIGPLGAESRGYLPARNAAFAIWERPVLSLVAGEVVHVVDDVADNPAFGSEHPYGVGNHVVVGTDGDVYAVVGHLRQGSVECSVGQRVSAGEVLGRAGNSGWTERPHVHFQAMRAPDGDWWHGEPVPVTFGGRLLVRNDTWRAQTGR